jgi:hypothetical protein
LILANIDSGFSEGVGYGMIGWSVPHSRYPAGYHCDPKQPLPYAGLASQKNYMSLYICPPSMSDEGDSEVQAEDDWFRSAWAKTGKKLDMGKSCIRFRKLEDLALDVIAESFRRMTAERFIAQYEAARAAHQPKSRAEIQAMMAERKTAAAKKVTKPAPAKKAAVKKAAAKKTAAKKTAAKKTAAKKTAAKKTAAKKTAAKKTTSQKK